MPVLCALHWRAQTCVQTQNVHRQSGRRGELLEPLQCTLDVGSPLTGVHL